MRGRKGEMWFSLKGRRGKVRQRVGEGEREGRGERVGCREEGEVGRGGGRRYNGLLD